MHKIALVNQKGGVGKTTTAVNLSSALELMGNKVLLIDLDPQSNATIAFGITPHELKNTTYTLLRSDAKPSEVIREVKGNLFIIPSNIDLAGAELELSTLIGREYVLKNAMEGVDNFDFILIDCPPSLGLLNINGLTYADEVLIPLQCEFFALQGISLLLKTIDLVKKRLNPNLTISGVIPCMFDIRKGLSKEVIKEIENFFKEKVFKTRVRTNVRLAEAPSHGKSIFDYAPDSYGAEDYMNLAKEVLGAPLSLDNTAQAVQTPSLRQG